VLCTATFSSSLEVVAGPKNGRPWGTGKLEGPGFTASRGLRQGRPRPLDLLDLRGGGPCRTLGCGSLFDGGGRLVKSANFINASSNWSGWRRSRLSDNGLCRTGLCNGGWSFSSFRRLGERCFVRNRMLVSLRGGGVN
jgi:hypothetical protein